MAVNPLANILTRTVWLLPLKAKARVEVPVLLHIIYNNMVMMKFSLR